MRPFRPRRSLATVLAALLALTAGALSGCQTSSRERYYRAQEASFAPTADAQPGPIRTASAGSEP